MSSNLPQEQALILVERAQRHQARGELGDAIALYRQSIALFPTAEAHTFLGWAYSMMGRYAEAIAECERAIKIDPEFGNPYNDIGAYMLETGRLDEAIPWLQRALDAPRYEPRHFPCMNLGRVYEKLGRYRTALTWYDKALAIDPYDQSARRAKYALLGRVS